MRILLVALLVGVGLAGCTEEPVQPQSGVIDQGINSEAELAAPGTFFNTRAEFEAFWADHRPGTEAPGLDWNARFVVVLAMGQQPIGGSLIGAKTVEYDAPNQTYRIGYDIILPGEDCPEEPPSNPFQIVWIDRVDDAFPKVGLDLLRRGIASCTAS